MADGFEQIIDDHRETSRLFERYERDSDDGIARKACEGLAVHAGAEEMVLYPHLRDGSPDGDHLAERAELEHASITALIARVFEAPPIDLSDLIAEIADQVRSHVEFEETEVLPRLRQRVDGDALAREFTAAKDEVLNKGGDRPTAGGAEQ